MILPSKELMTIVLGVSCTPFKFTKYYFGNAIVAQNHESTKCNGYGNEISINIYEFAHMCKDWAKEQGYILMIFGSVVYVVTDDFDSDYFEFSNYKNFSEKTIQESIFAACEYILNEIK